MPGAMLVSDINQETIDAVRQALTATGEIAKAGDTTTQGYTTDTGLVGINLESPAKSLFPVLSPWRNRFPRRPAAVGASAVQWRAITAINAANVKAGVAEGLRNTPISVTEANKSQAYKEFGLDNFVTFKAQDFGRGFDDVLARGVANTLAATMVEEEKILVGGNTVAIGKPASVTADDTATDGSGALSAATTYYYAVSALTLYGFLNGAKGGSAPDETDGRTGSHDTTASGAGSDAIHIVWPAVRGAAAYNIFAGASTGGRKWLATVTANEYTILANAAGGNNLMNAADLTADALSFDGVIPQIEGSGLGAYWSDMAASTLTGDNAGGITQIDAMLQSLWDNSRIGPTLIAVNSQQAKDLLRKIAANGSTTTFRVNLDIGADGSVRGGMRLGSYLNAYTNQDIPIDIHPFLPPGKIVALSERLPFPMNNVPNPFEVDVNREYTQYDWARVQRKFEFGVYGTECLKVYFPAGCGVLTGIKPG